MAKQDNNIRSTEKLLEIIRNNESTDPVDPPSPKSAATVKAPKKSLIQIVSFQKKITVGVDIGHTNIRLAKIIRSEKSSELIDYLDVPLSKTASMKDPAFKETLKSAMLRFCGEDTSCDIWGAIHSANVETRCILIPKLQQKQMANAIFWTFTKKVAFDEKTEILDYEVLGDVTVGGMKKTEVLTFKAPKADVADFEAAFQEIGFPLKGISIVPFAIQNLFRARTIASHDTDACCLFIGRDWSRIAIYNKGNLVLSRGIKAGMRSMIEAINAVVLRSAKKTPPAENYAGNSPDANSAATTIHPQAQKIFFDFINRADGAKSDGDQTPVMDPAKVFKMVLPALERLVRQVERTFEHYAMNFTREGVGRIFISGQVIANSVILDYLGKQLDLPVVPMNPFTNERGFSQKVRIPDSASGREGYVPAVGLALSRNDITPNFLYTHENKQAAETVRRNNMRILTSCMVLLMVMIGIFSWQQKQLDGKSDTIEKLDNKLLAYSPPAEKEILVALFAKTKSKRRSISEIVYRYAPVSVVSELSTITPSNIRLLTIEANMGPAGAKKGPKKKSSHSVRLEGVVFGNPEMFEISLTNYMLGLKNSPIFRKPNVRDKQIEYFNNQKVLRFSTSVEII